MFISKGVIVSTKGRNRPERSVSATETGKLPYFPMDRAGKRTFSVGERNCFGKPCKTITAPVVIGERTYGKGKRSGTYPAGQQGRRN